MNLYVYICLILLFVSLCTYAAYSIYNNYKIKMSQNKYKENKEFLKKRLTYKPELYFFYTDWCPHCKTAMPIWESIRVSSSFNEYNINFMAINCEETKNKSLIKRHNIKDYPSYVLNVNGKSFVYDANLDEDTLKRFIKAVYDKI